MFETTKQYNMSIKTHHCWFNINQAHRGPSLLKSTEPISLVCLVLDRNYQCWDNNHQQEGWKIPPLATDMGTPATDNGIYIYMAVCQNLVPLVNIKIAGKWMFIPLKMVCIGIDPYPYIYMGFNH
jgi:hypothetical protein